MPGWPPSYEDAKADDLEGMSLTLKLLRVSAETYGVLVDLVERMLRDPYIVALRDALARALDATSYLDEEAINEIATAYRFPLPAEAEEVACNT